MLEDKLKDWRRYLNGKLELIKDLPVQKNLEDYVTTYKACRYYLKACTILYDRNKNESRDVAKEYLIKYSETMRTKEQKLWDWWM
jgi:hypothetical protein